MIAGMGIFGALFRGLQASIRERRERDERIRRYARKRPPRRKPPAAGIAAPAVPPRGPVPLQGGAEAPLEFD